MICTKDNPCEFCKEHFEKIIWEEDGSCYYCKFQVDNFGRKILKCQYCSTEK